MKTQTISEMCFSKAKEQVGSGIKDMQYSGKFTLHPLLNKSLFWLSNVYI